MDGDAIDLRRSDPGFAHIRLDFRQGIAVGKRLRLRKAVLQSQILSLRASPGTTQRRDKIERLGQRALVQHLKERMLGVRARFAPHDGRGREIHVQPLQGYRLAVAFHFELLQVCGQAREALIVRQHRERGQIQESSIPHAEHAHQDRQIFLERRGRKMFIDVARALEKLFEAFAADDDLGNEADGGPNRITTPDPIPHREAMVRRDAKLVHGLCIGRDGDEVIAGGLLPQCADDPSARGIGVGLCLLRHKGLGAHDHQRLRRIERARQVLELRAIHVGYEVRRDVAAPFRAQRIAYQQGP